MRVAVFPADQHGVGWVRLRWPAAELRRQGYDVTVYDDIPVVWRREEEGEDTVADLLETPFDVAVLQRVWRPRMLAFQRLLQQRGIVVCQDIDDDLFALHPDHVAYPKMQEFGVVLRQAVREADLITVSTPALAKRYGAGKARIVPNGIPRGYLEIPTHPSRQVPVVGWTGTVQTHPHCLEQVGSSVSDLVRSGKARFRAIGDPAAVREIGAGTFQQGASIEDFAYARLYADLDVAIVPLQASRFNAAKSWLKGLEAAALGVPFVASPTPEYVRLHELGAGLLAESPKEWKAQIGRLVGSADLRAEYAAKGRVVAAGMTTEAMQAPRLWDAWATCASSAPSFRAALSAS